jgi:hypothetical protein
MVRGASVPLDARRVRPFHLLEKGLTAAGRIFLGGFRFMVAGAILLATSYVLGWRILSDGLAGSDSLFHLDLASWVASAFPSIGWWYPWDGNGISYREGYPLAAHWVTVLLSGLSGWSLPQAMQVVQFSVNPLCALGVYAFSAWRLGRPLVGLIAGFLYLLSPMPWTFLVDWGFYSNQVATVLFMPTLFALDVVASEWRAGGRGLRLRVSASAFVGLTSLLGMVGPALMGAALVAVPAYALAQGGWRPAWRWLLVVTPLLGVGSVLLSAFWAVPVQSWLSVAASRQPARVYSPNLYHLWSVRQVLELNPLRVTGNVQIQDRTSLTPAVWIPAILGLVAAAWDGRSRAFAVLAGFGLLTMTAPWLYSAIYPIPLAVDVINFRSGMLFLQFLVPILAASGFVVVPQTLAAWLLRRRSGRWMAAGLGAAIALAGLAVAITVVASYAHYVVGSQNQLAYGPYVQDQRDLWKRHLDDVCAVKTSDPCASPTLTSNFSVAELVPACADYDGHLRTSVPICAALQDPTRPVWSSSDDGLVATTVDWCHGSGRGDPVCAARYQTLAEQLLDPRWPQLGCLLPDCGGVEARLAANRTLIASPPVRAELDAQTDTLLKAMHYLTGGAQVDSYNFQLLPSPELNSWTKDSMLYTSGEVVKAELSAVEGIDTVVLSGAETAQASDYQNLGWQLTAPYSPANPATAGSPIVLLAPNPTGLAEQRPGKATVLVIGAVGDTPSDPYNQVFEHATTGMIPFANAWLVKGPSPYIDDYSDPELASNQALLLLAYRYHDAQAAWDRLDRYVRNGGRLYVETGWQYVDPDWGGGPGLVPLPVEQLTWAALNPSAPVIVNGAPDPGWGPLSFDGGGWGASSAGSVRSGAEALVEVGGRVVVARWDHGAGRVVWSGMNLIAHQQRTGSAEEARFLQEQWAWLLGEPAGASTQLSPRWNGDSAILPLEPSDGLAVVIFKESNAPGWSAELRWPGGSKPLAIEDAEEDFMLVRLPSIPVGAELVFHYGPTTSVLASWAASALTLGVLLVWLAWPRPFRALRRRVLEQVSHIRRGWLDEQA